MLGHMHRLTALRINHSTQEGKNHRVELELDDLPGHHAASASFTFGVSRRDQEDIRWYLEDYLDYPFDPAPEIAARVERRMADIGRELFIQVFDSTPDGRSLWQALSHRLAETRITISSGDQTLSSLPWELLMEPSTGRTLATESLMFTRAPTQESRSAPQRSRSIRIMALIARPKGPRDVPFRSVALRMVSALSRRDDVEIDVLRPPTFPELEGRLKEASAAGRPYHVVHFDGHGSYQDLSAELVELPPTRPRGYVWFEDTAGAEQLIDGGTLGKLLAATGVRLLLLNACRSAYVEPAERPLERPSVNRGRGFESLADEVIASGVPGVVAMQYNINESAAADFYDATYGALVQGVTLGEAVTRGRRRMQLQPLRQGFDARPLVDWVIPVVYQAAAAPLFHRLDRRRRQMSPVRPPRYDELPN